MKVIQVYRSGVMDEISVSLPKCDAYDASVHLTPTFEEMSKSQGGGTLRCLYSWSYGNHTIQCYGWYEGDAGFENTTELPPGGKSLFLDTDSSVQLLFGDIFICKGGATPTNIDIAEYSEFYTQACGGFDECDTDTDSEDMNTESEDEDFVVGPHEVMSEEDCVEDEDEESTSDEDAELEEDEYDY